MEIFFTTLNPLVVFGVLSALLSSFAFVPYILDTLSNRTQPQRASWLIWSILGSIALTSQIVEGATDSLWFAGVQVGGTILVFLLSIRLGVGGFLNRSDFGVLICAAIGLGLWSITESSLYALGISISISLLGGSVTVLKAYRNPESETMTTWAFSFIAACFALLSVGHFDLILMAYPLYLFVLNGAIVAAILLGRAAKPQTGAMNDLLPAE